jgi:hypothetical protein
MLCLEAMHNVSMRLGRMDEREGAFCRVFIIYVWERFAVVTAVGFHATEWNTFVSTLSVNLPAPKTNKHNELSTAL